MRSSPGSAQRLRTIPDLKWEIKDVLVSGNQVTVRGEATGTPAGELMGNPTNGKSFKLMSIDVHTLRGRQDGAHVSRRGLEGRVASASAAK